MGIGEKTMVARCKHCKTDLVYTRMAFGEVFVSCRGCGRSHTYHWTQMRRWFAAVKRTKAPCLTLDLDQP